jgi:MYXO-CTERM domain-containing protein
MRQGRFGLAFVLTTLRAVPAGAWQIEDVIHQPCHERISQAALDRVGYAQEPPTLEADDARLRDNVDFKATRYDANLYALSLVIGVRNADTHGGASFSFGNNATAANAADDQSAHCLRTASQDGPQGDAQAIADCRAWIESLYWQALASLDENGDVAPDQRTYATVATEFQGSVSYRLSGLYYHGGRAIHAVQDSFTHSFRSPDWHRIRHVFNWSDQVSCTLDEARDGHGHETVLDDCKDGDPTEAERFEVATQASADLLSALTRPGPHAERAQRIADFLENWMAYEPDCTLDNAYCDNAVYDWLKRSDRSDAGICDGPLGCQITPASKPRRSNHGLLAAAALAFAALGLRRRRGLATAALGAALLLAPRTVRADEREDEREDEPVAARGPRKVGGPRLEARASLSVDNPAYAFGVAGLYGFKHADLGIFAELNPWYSIDRRRMSLGATNFGVLGHYLHPLRRDLVLRFGLGLGMSMLNADMLGVNAGNLGLFLDVRAMGLIWEFADGVALTADPLDLALPAPGLTGWPILFTQHRMSLGLQFAL